MFGIQSQKILLLLWFPATDLKLTISTDDCLKEIILS